MNLDRELDLRVICPAPPPSHHEERPTEFGLQAGKQSLVPGATAHDGSIAFECHLVSYTDKQGRSRFRGDCAQGTPAEPFLYLSWRFADGPQVEWIGRVKVLLAPLRELMEHAPAGPLLVETPSLAPGQGVTRQGDWRIV